MGQPQPNQFQGGMEGFGGASGAGAQQSPQMQNNMTPEVQTIMIEAQRLNLQQQGRHEEAAMYPITEITPDVPAQ